MKKQTRTKTAMKLSAMIVSAFMMLAACTETVQKQKIPGATYMGGNNTITEICKELDSAGAAHVDIFREWAVDFADSAGKNAKLEDTWSDPGKMKADIGKCMDGWEQNHDYSDADCRMTAFLLLDGVIRSELTEDHYEGTFDYQICDRDDIIWLNAFYNRIMKRTDPLAVHYRAGRKAQNTVRNNVHHSVLHSVQHNSSRHRKNRKANVIFNIIFFLIIIACACCIYFFGVN